MNLSDKKLILFDLDGILIDSASDLAQSINFMLRELNRSTFSEDIIRSWVGNGAKRLVQRALGDDKLISLSKKLAKDRDYPTPMADRVMPKG